MSSNGGSASANGGVASANGHAPSANGGGPSANGAAPAAPLALLQQFMGVQEARAKLYSDFHAAFRRFLASREEGAYKRMIQQITADFSACSQQVRRGGWYLLPAAAYCPCLFLCRVQAPY